jgi:hypothetical protein
MDKFLDAYGQPNLNQNDINLNRSIVSREFEATIKSLSKEKSLGPYVFIDYFH